MQDFDKIYSQYFSYVYKFVLALCHDSHIAEEITQETFFRALKSIDDFEGKANVSSWLCQIAKNTYLSYIKKQKNVESLEDNEEVCIKQDDIESMLADKELAFSIHQKLHDIKEPYKEVFLQV